MVCTSPPITRSPAADGKFIVYRHVLLRPTEPSRANATGDLGALDADDDHCQHVCAVVPVRCCAYALLCARAAHALICCAHARCMRRAQRAQCAQRTPIFGISGLVFYTKAKAFVKLKQFL